MDKNELYNVKDVIDFQIRKVARTAPLPYKELYQIGYLGYLKAQNNYKPEYGQMSLSYASKYIRQELINTLRKEYAIINQTSGLEDDTVEDATEDKANVSAGITIQLIKDSLHILPVKCRDIVEACYLSDKPKRLIDIAREQGVSKQRIFELKSKGIKILREVLRGKGYEV